MIIGVDMAIGPDVTTVEVRDVSTGRLVEGPFELCPRCQRPKAPLGFEPGIDIGFCFNRGKIGCRNAEAKRIEREHARDHVAMILAMTALCKMKCKRCGNRCSQDHDKAEKHLCAWCLTPEWVDEVTDRPGTENAMRLDRQDKLQAKARDADRDLPDVNFDDRPVLAEQKKIAATYTAENNFDGLLGPATDVEYKEPCQLARLKFREPVIDPRSVDRSKKGFQSVRMVTELFFELPARSRDRLGNIPPPPATLQIADHLFGWAGPDDELETVLPRVQKYIELDAPLVIPRDQYPVDSPVVSPF